MKNYVLAIGELLADVISTEYCDNLEEAQEFKLIQGGSPANVAANINHLGGSALLVSCVGNDGFGKRLINTVRSSGLDVAYIQVHPTEPTSIVMVTKSRGTPDFIAYRHADANITNIDKSLIEQAAVIHTTAFALSRQPAQGAILQAMEMAYTRKKTVSVDWNFAPCIWGTDDGKAVFESVMQFRPLLKLSLDDMERFWGEKLTIAECKKRLEHYDAAAICITCGKDGIWFKESARPWQFSPAKSVAAVVDVTGAGDAFWAGFLTSFLNGEQISDCVKNGAAVAANKIQKEGPLYF